MKNEKTHAMLLTLVGGYLFYLAFQLFNGYRAGGSEDMPGYVFILFIILFLGAGAGTLFYAWRTYRKIREEEENGSGKKQENSDGTDGKI